mgnify:CR=1 FL=1
MGEFPSKENQFKKGQSGNPGGRPPKLLKKLFKELKKEGFERVAVDEIYETIEYMLGATLTKSAEISNDKGKEENILIVRHLARALADKKYGFKNMMDMIKLLIAKQDEETVDKIEVEIVKRKK